MNLKWDYNHPADKRIMEPDEQPPHETLDAYKSHRKEKILFDRHNR